MRATPGWVMIAVLGNKWQHLLLTARPEQIPTKQEILSLVGLLQHANIVVRRTFVAWKYQSAAKLEKLKIFTGLMQSFHSEFYWWHTFIANWNGLCILRKPNHANHFNFRVFSDALGSWGCGAQWERRWFQWQWPLVWHPIGIMAKELVISWGHALPIKLFCFCVITSVWLL